MRGMRQPGSGERAPQAAAQWYEWLLVSPANPPAAPDGNEGACSALAVVSTGLVRSVNCGTWGKTETWEPSGSQGGERLGVSGNNSDRLSIAPATVAQS